jgi:hypothetical protein
VTIKELVQKAIKYFVEKEGVAPDIAGKGTRKAFSQGVRDGNIGIGIEYVAHNVKVPGEVKK